VNIVDDVPKANADVASVGEGGVITGNVLANDVGGADGPAVGGGVVGVRAGSDTSTPVVGGLNSQINGTYGYLTLDAHGNAEYHSYPNSVNGPGATDTFTYTLRDGDGDQSTTTITIDVHNSCIQAVSDNDVTVFEKALDFTKDGQDLSGGYATGSEPGNTGETASGTLVGSVTGGSGALTYSLVGSTQGNFGLIQLNPDGTYTYTLTNPAHTTPQANDGPNTVTETFTYHATDSLGNVATSTIVVNIVDDVPKANADVASVGEGGVITGNVLANDVGGADGPAVGGGVVGVRAGSDTSTPVVGGLNSQINGTYGYLTLDAHGNAEYHSYPNSVNGPGATDTFTYTLRDGDGDQSTTTITIDVHNSCIQAVSDNDVTVFEKALDFTKDGQDLSGGYATGSEPGNTGETASGTLVGSVTGGSGALTYSLVGSTQGNFGLIQLNPDGTYTYTLTNPAHTTPQANDGPNTVTETFTYHATDSLGNVATSTIVVNIVDDVPKANADVASVGEGGIITGNVLANDVGGADGPAAGGGVVGVRAGSDTSTPVVGGLNSQINGTYGYLTLDAHGNAEYHSYPNSVNGPGATDTFTYTLRDGDGDQSTTTITIDVHNSCLQAVSDNDVTVFEKALDFTKDGQDLSGGYATGSEPGNTGETASGTLVGSVTGGSGALTYTLVGSAQGNFGLIQLNPDGTYTYTLTNPAHTTPQANDGPNTVTETFTYHATDSLGNVATSTIVVNIVDDVPKANADVASVGEGGIITGNVLANDVGGADGPAVGGGVVGVRAGSDTSTPVVGGLNSQINGTYGYLTLDAHGNAEYHSYPNSVNGPGATDTFTYTLRDGDGDQSTTTITIDVHNSCIQAVSDNDVTVFEKALDFTKDGQDLSGGYATGSEPGNTGETASGTLVGAVTGGSGALTYSLVGSAQGNFGLIQLNPDGTYTYTLTNPAHTTPQANDGPNTVTETFTYHATDSLGNVATSTIVVNIVDDVPKANADVASVGEGGIITGNVLANDVGGADGPAAGGGVVGVRAGSDTSTPVVGGLNTQINGTYGYLTLDAHGNAEYHSYPNSVNGPGATDTFTYTLRDGDGDQSTTTITIDVHNSCIQAVSNNDGNVVAVDDHVITNVLSGSVTLPGELLLANDTAANGDPLTVSPTTFNTGWISKAADFTGTGAINFKGTNPNSTENQNLCDVRSAFSANAATMTAVLVVSGFLGAVTNAHANDEDRITVNLKQGETLNLDHNLAAGHVAMEYSVDGGAWIALADGQTLTATSDATYQIHITNITNTSGSNSNGAEDYQLTMTVNYAGAHDIAPDYHGAYTASDSHGGSDSANLTISYQDSHILTGTAGNDTLVAGNGDNILNGGDGNDILIAGTGNNELHGGAGNDLLYSGPGNDLLDGGIGNDTASYAHATAGVTVNLSLLGAQDTLGAGIDTLTGIENLTGSNYNDTLTGDNNNNIINGGLGNDVLNGGGGDDILIGGLGNNTLTGGSGADTFEWLKGNSGHDVITDFAPGTDKLDLSQLLQGETNTAASLDNYLHFTVNGSGASVVTSIDVSALAGAAPNQTIDLAGVNLASHYGVTPGAGGVITGADTATIINGMLNDHSLKVDTV
ncbi:beta strand repeat-containing protein, partial [Pseudomonas moorei]|uniref:beta strand repeat-containing protein n=1 Tax=Pseudomonas moorei TaxID=395599 RepID=UPI001248A3A2